MGEIEDQARTNEEIVTHLDRKGRVDEMRSRMDRDFIESKVSLSASQNKFRGKESLVSPDGSRKDELLNSNVQNDVDKLASPKFRDTDAQQ